ncbi:MAG: ABC transporter substrate-binding protein [Acidimicrobiia bacterium]|nr:ABC transporter substrate-binding protein [Acidimicrobiia bacterium]
MHRRGVLMLLVFALLAATCSSSDDEAGTDPPPSTTDAAVTTAAPSTAAVAPTSTTPALTASFRGVTEEVIKVGVLSLDWQALADLGVNLGRGTSDDLYSAALEAINDRGGIHGRMLELHPVTIFPVGTAESEAACVELTQDIEVFVVAGAMIGDSVLCYTEQHDTAVVVAASRPDERIERAVAPYATINGATTDQARRFVEIMEERGLLEDATIGVVGAVDTDEDTYRAVFAAFEEAGYDPVPGLIGGNQEDLVESANEQAVIFERMEAEGVDVTVSTVGVPLGMANAIDAGYETDQWLLYGLLSPFGLRDANVPLEYLDGAVGVGVSPVGTSVQPTLRDDPVIDACLTDLDERTGRTAVVDLDAPVNDLSSYLAACSFAAILEQGLLNAGPDLTNESFQAGLEAIGEIDLPGYRDAYLEPGHLGAADGFFVAVMDAEAGVWQLDE